MSETKRPGDLMTKDGIEYLVITRVDGILILIPSLTEKKLVSQEDADKNYIKVVK